MRANAQKEQTPPGGGVRQQLGALSATLLAPGRHDPRSDYPAEEPGHEISLTCDDLDGTIADLRARGVTLRGEPEDRQFGHAVTLVLPGGVEVLLYQPNHPTPLGSRE